jgi:hypothetical protein
MENGEKIENNQDISDGFNNFFVTVGSKLEGNIPVKQTLFRLY